MGVPDEIGISEDSNLIPTMRENMQCLSFWVLGYLTQNDGFLLPPFTFEFCSDQGAKNVRRQCSALN